MIAIVFFFSSRRRHTRFDCDWSSDVCSSDLPAAVHGRALWLRGGALPGCRGRELPLARASVLHGDRGRRAGARGRGSRGGSVNLQSIDHVEPFTTKDGSTIRELHHTPAQSLAEAALEPGQATERHYHGRTEEISLVPKGAGPPEGAGQPRRCRPPAPAVYP